MFVFLKLNITMRPPLVIITPTDNLLARWPKNESLYRVSLHSSLPTSSGKLTCSLCAV
jgi:hypothetical protein